MAWWTTNARGRVEKHATKLDAGIRLLFARTLGGQALKDLGLYRRDPVEHPDEPNVLPEGFAQWQRKQGRTRRRTAS